MEPDRVPAPTTSEDERFGTTGPSGPGGKRRGRWFIAAAILVLVLAPRVAGSIHDFITAGEDDEDIRYEVDITIATPTTLEETLSSAGTLRANREVELSAEVAGIVTEIRIDEGSEVSAGDPLVQINDSELRAELRGVQYELEVMEEAAERQRRLVEEGGTTRDQYDATLMRVNELRSSRENLLAQLQRREIRAPFDGIVGLAHADPGSYLSPGSRIATLQDVSSMRIDFFIPERYSARVGPGTVVRFTVPGSDSIFEGSVRAVEPRVDPRTRSVQVLARAENENGVLRPGAFANVELILAAQPDAILIPSIALIRRPEGSFVMVMRDGQSTETRVDLGVRRGDRVQVTGGVNPGDTIIMNGLHRITDGTPVTPRPTPQGDRP